MRISNRRDGEVQGCPYILAEQQLATAAVEALVAEFAVVGSDPVADLESLDVLGMSLTQVSLGAYSVQVRTLPTAAMTPTVSWPGMRGNLAINSPSWMCYKHQST